MIHSLYNLVFYGEIAEGYSVEQIRQYLASDMIPDASIRERLFAGKSVIIREHLDYMAASTLQSTCEMNGAICHIELVQVKTAYDSIDPSKLCNLEFRGELRAGYRLEEVKERLHTQLKTNAQTIAHLFSGKAVLIKQEVDYKTALQLQEVFEQAGAICRITASQKSLAQEYALQNSVFLPENLDQMICPNCGLRQENAPACPQCGIVTARFVKRRRRPIRRSAPRAGNNVPVPAASKAAALQVDYAEEEYEEPAETEALVEAYPGRPEIPFWQIGLVGNALLVLLLTIFDISLLEIIVPFSLNPEIYLTPTIEVKSILAVLISNARIIGLIGPPVPLLLYFRKTLYKTARPALRYKFWTAVLIVAGSILMIDMFVTLRGGFAFVGAFSLKVFGFSAIAYLLGFGVLGVFKWQEMFPPVDEQVERDFLDEDESVTENSSP